MQRGRALLLALVLVGGAALRLVDLDRPRGLSVDEASNVWTARCLAETGRDEHGKPWPVLYTEAFGENRSPSYSYALLPFVWTGGDGVRGARLPAALGGILTLGLLYWVAARWFGPSVALASTFLIAVTPWHLATSRMALEASLTPLLLLGTIAAILRAPGIVGAALAGVVAAASCYGYWAVRLVLPLLLVALALSWWTSLRPRLREVGAFVAAFVVTISPLVVGHLADPGTLAKRGLVGLAWGVDDPLPTRVAKVVGRYAAHFGPDFLFLRGDVMPAHSLPGSGVLALYTLPFLLIGLAVLVARWRVSAPARFVLLWLALYPVGDVLKDHPSAHLLRSLPGLPVLVLVAGIGVAEAGAFLARKGRRAVVAGIVVLASASAFFDGRFLARYHRYRGTSAVYRGMQVELSEASRRIRTWVPDLDAVFFTTRDLSFPYVVTLVEMRYEPARWLRDVREYGSDGEWRTCTRYGKVRFLYGERDWEALRELARNGRRDRIALVVRPEEAPPPEVARPADRVLDPDGRVALVLYRFDD